MRDAYLWNQLAQPVKGAYPFGAGQEFVAEIMASALYQAAATSLNSLVGIGSVKQPLLLS